MRMGDDRYLYPEAIVSTEWLADHVDDPDLRIYDCTTYLDYETADGSPYRVVSGCSDYDAGHILNSTYLDLQGDFSLSDSPYRFTLPDVADLAERFQAHGIGDNCRVILYSRANMQWATRIWWMLRWVGYDNAAVLDGGWDKWTGEGRDVSTEQTVYPAARFTSSPRPEIFVDKDAVLDVLGGRPACVINALTEDLHSGANPRYGRPGRIPGSVNLPALGFQDDKTRSFPAAEAARVAFERVGADPAKPMIVYCGGGIAATLDAFLAYQLGFQNVSVYDNSMSEWAADVDLPIETD